MSRNARRGLSVASALFVLALAPAVAAEVKPARERCDILETATSIPGFAPVAVAEKAAPKFPKRSLNTASEGWVLLQYAVDPEGTVKNVEVVDTIGAKDFGSAAVKAISEWRFKPATRAGAAVEQHLHKTAMLFRLEDSGRNTSHADFVKKYNRARDLLNEGDHDTAITTLEQGFKAGANLYEAAMGSYALALAYTQKKDWPRALFHMRHAVINDQKYLIDDSRVPALASLVELESRNGNFLEALCAFDRLHPLDPESARGASPAAKIAAQLETALADPAPLVIAGEIATHPQVDAPASWRHRLLRPKFSFAEVKGEVKSFSLSCIGSSLSSAVNTVMQWTVPPKAGACILRVDGEPGATFKLVEKL